MKNTTKTTTANTTTKTTAGFTFWDWNVESIFSASFMFPTKHFKTEADLQTMPDIEFFPLIEEMLQVCQPLSSNEQQGLRKSVNSGNRLRIYYQAISLADIQVAISKDVSSDDTETSSLSDKDLREAYAHNGFQIVDEGSVDILSNEDRSSDKYLG